MGSEVDFATVLGWRPCEDFPPSRIRELFAGRERVTVEDVIAVDIRQDEQLWMVLREAFFSAQDLDDLGLAFVGHVCDLAEDDRVVGEMQYAVCALEGRFDLLPVDNRHERWESGATEAEKRVALAALWAATARANTVTNRKERFARWNQERDWQVSAVKEKAGLS